ncbi:MAG: mechanosensitive ion channel family protein [Chloroflexaceae bacterium]
MPDTLPFQELVMPLAFLLGGLLAGLIVDKVILKQVIRFWARKRGEQEVILLSRLRGTVLVWFVAAGAYGASMTMPLDEQMSRFVQQAWMAVVIFSVALLLARLATGMLNFYLRRVRNNEQTTSLITNIIQALVLGIGVLVLLQSVFGISITPILTTLGVGGLAVALALQETLANLFAGFFLVVARKVRSGDYVKLDSGEEGYIVDIEWRNTSIRMLANNVVLIPNSRLSSAIVTNYDRPGREMAVLVDLGVSYSSNLRRVEQVTVEVAQAVMREVPGGIPDFEPFIRYNTFADFSINFTVILRAREFVDQYLIKHEFIKRLHERYNQEGIEIPFPIRTVYHKGDTAAAHPANGTEHARHTNREAAYAQ